jgi:hypothetical protein
VGVGAAGAEAVAAAVVVAVVVAGVAIVVAGVVAGAAGCRAAATVEVNGAHAVRVRSRTTIPLRCQRTHPA